MITDHKFFWENIAGAKRYSRPCGFVIVGVTDPVAPAVPTPIKLRVMLVPTFSLIRSRSSVNWSDIY